MFHQRAVKQLFCAVCLCGIESNRSLVYSFKFNSSHFQLPFVSRHYRRYLEAVEVRLFLFCCCCFSVFVPNPHYFFSLYRKPGYFSSWWTEETETWKRRGLTREDKSKLFSFCCPLTQTKPVFSNRKLHPGNCLVQNDFTISLVLHLYIWTYMNLYI